MLTPGVGFSHPSRCLALSEIHGVSKDPYTEMAPVGCPYSPGPAAGDAPQHLRHTSLPCFSIWILSLVLCFHVMLLINLWSLKFAKCCSRGCGHLQGAVSAVSRSCPLLPGTHLLQVRCSCRVLSGQSVLGGTGRQHRVQQGLVNLLSILHPGLALMGVASALCQTVFSSFVITVRKACKK